MFLSGRARRRSGTTGTPVDHTPSLRLGSYWLDGVALGSQCIL